MRLSSVGRMASVLAVATLLGTTIAHGQDLPGGYRTESEPLEGGFAPPPPDSWPRSALRTADDPTGRSYGLSNECGAPSANNTSYEAGGWDILGLYDAPGRHRHCGERLADLEPVCDECPTWGSMILVGYDSWRGVADGSWGNNGIHAGVNVATRLGRLSEWTGIGAQAGGSVGVYNWNGTDYHLEHSNAGTTQGFITYGLFRKANAESRWSASVVQDWMLNSNFSVFGQDPTLSQFRGQLGYAVSSADELGVWGAWRGWGETELVSTFGPVTWRPINQVSAYWHHKWGVGEPDTWLWVGVPERHRLTGNGSLGDYYVGVLANAPLSDSVSLYAQVTYMHPSASPSPAGSREDQWNFFIGLSLFPARNARNRTVAGQCWMPQVPVANNGTFLVDASQNY